MSGIDAFVGEIALFPYDFAPVNWAPCDGRLLSISSNTALFSILGTTYGGNGVTTFGLPNLNGRTAVGAGQGPGLSSYQLGERGGEAEVILTGTQMPPHGHATRAASGSASTDNPVGAVPASGTVPLRNAEPTLQESLESAGDGRPHNNMQPSLALHYCIALAGVFPPRP